MQINWFTVIAQVINFLVLVWLLKKFLYKPILKGVDDRETKIAAQIENATQLKAAAKKEQDDFAKKNSDFDAHKKELLNNAVADVNTQRQMLLDGARTEAIQLGAKLEAASQKKQQADTIAITQKIHKGVLSITRKALTEIASETLEEQSVNVFIKRLKELNDEGKKQFFDAFTSDTNTIFIRSAFDLPEERQLEISNAINELLKTQAHLQFKIAPGIISGIELTINGYKLAWSFSEYMNELEKRMEVPIAKKAAADQNEKIMTDKSIDTEKNAAIITNSISVNGNK